MFPPYLQWGSFTSKYILFKIAAKCSENKLKLKIKKSIVSNPWDFIPDLNEAYFLVICEWLMDHELDRSFEGCRYELFWYFLVICEWAKLDFWIRWVCTSWDNNLGLFLNKNSNKLSFFFYKWDRLEMSCYDLDILGLLFIRWTMFKFKWMWIPEWKRH